MDPPTDANARREIRHRGADPGTANTTYPPLPNGSGDPIPLSNWLRDNLYSLGRKLTPKETIERLTGSPEIDPGPYLDYLRDKQAALVT